MKLEVLRAALETENADRIRAALHRVVPTFREPDEINAAQVDTVRGSRPARGGLMRWRERTGTAQNLAAAQTNEPPAKQEREVL